MKFKLHHIGIAIKNIDESKKYYIELLGYNEDKIIIDKQQNLKALYLTKDGTQMELLQKIDNNLNSPIDNILKSMGGGIHHYCYEVNNLESKLKEVSKYGFIKINKKIHIYTEFKTAFFITPDNLLVELLERY